MIYHLVQAIASAVANVWEMGHHPTGRVDSFTSHKDVKLDNKCTSLHMGHQQKGTWLQLPYYALLCLIELIRHNKA
jgi:hypothetical protein